MENSKLRDQIISLGKLLVNELDLENRSDTLARWVAHYIAEKIAIAENTSGSSKAEAQQECFETILKLWELRWSFPATNRPLKDFESIMDFVQNLDSNDETPRYYIRHEKQLLGKATEKEVKSPIHRWLNMGKEVDKAAKSMIKFILEQAALHASDQKTKEWLDNSTSLPHTYDVQIIKIILGKVSESGEENFEERYEIEQIKKRINEIETFDIISAKILEGYRERLKGLTNI